LQTEALTAIAEGLTLQFLPTEVTNVTNSLIVRSIRVLGCGEGAFVGYTKKGFVPDNCLQA
jgi:hypothetical protein